MKTQIEFDKIQISKNVEIDSIYFRIKNLNLTIDDRVIQEQKIVQIQVEKIKHVKSFEKQIYNMNNIGDKLLKLFQKKENFLIKFQTL